MDEGVIFSNNIVVDPSIIYACIAPVGGHTCITAGERSEPAVVDYKRMNVSVPVGGPTTTKSPSPNRQMREKQQDKLNNYGNNIANVHK